MTPMKAIRAKCLDCCCGSAHEVKLCTCQDCALHPFRFGRNPNITKREATPEQRAALEKGRLTQKLGFQHGEKSNTPIETGKDTPESIRAESARQST